MSEQEASECRPNPPPSRNVFLISPLKTHSKPYSSTYDSKFVFSTLMDVLSQWPPLAGPILQRSP